MSSASSSRRRGPYIPIVQCPDCRLPVKRLTSGTPKHAGWVYYKWLTHARGCVFWHWEREYVEYLLEHNYLVGDAAMDAMGWAEDRREELILRQAEAAATSPRQEDLVLKMLSSLVNMGKEAMILLRTVIVLLGVICLMLILKK